MKFLDMIVGTIIILQIIYDILDKRKWRIIFDADIQTIILSQNFGFIFVEYTVLLVVLHNVCKLIVFEQKYCRHNNSESS